MTKMVQNFAIRLFSFAVHSESGDRLKFCKMEGNYY